MSMSIRGLGVCSRISSDALMWRYVCIHPKLFIDNLFQVFWHQHKYLTTNLVTNNIFIAQIIIEQQKLLTDDKSISKTNTLALKFAMTKFALTKNTSTKLTTDNSATDIIHLALKLSYSLISDEIRNNCYLLLILD